MEAIKPESSPLRGLPANARQAIRAFCRPPPHPAAVCVAGARSAERRNSEDPWAGFLDDRTLFMGIQSYCWLHRDQLCLRYAAPWSMKIVCRQTGQLPQHARFPHETDRGLWSPALSWSLVEDLFADQNGVALHPLEILDGPALEFQQRLQRLLRAAEARHQAAQSGVQASGVHEARSPACHHDEQNMPLS